MNQIRSKLATRGLIGVVIAGGALLLATGLNCVSDKLKNTAAVPAPANHRVEEFEGPIRDRLRERVVTAIVRHRAVDRLERDGFALIGKDGTPLSRDKARELIERLDDEVVIGCVREASPQVYGKLGDGTLLSNLMTWISEHQEEILAILKLILSILVLL